MGAVANRIDILGGGGELFYDFIDAKLEHSQAPGVYVWHVRAPYSHPTISGELPRPRAMTHTLYPGHTF